MASASDLSLLLAGASSIFAAVSAATAWAAVRIMQRDLERGRAVKQHELATTFERDYTDQYDEIWKTLGPWPDLVTVDANVRRVVHRILQSTLSIFISERSGLVERHQVEATLSVYFDWLSLPVATDTWRAVFAGQHDTWPPGFASFVNVGIDRQIQARSKRPKPESVGGGPSERTMPDDPRLHTMDEFIDRLSSDITIARQRLRNLPIFVEEVGPTNVLAAQFAGELSHYYQCFPQLVASVVSLGTSDAARMPLLRNLWHEHGSGDAGQSHRFLMDEFVASVVATCGSLPDSNASHLDSTTNALSQLRLLCSTSFVQGLAAIAVGLELENDWQSEFARRYFGKLDRADNLNLRFFSLHGEVDADHAQVLISCLAEHVHTETDYREAVAGAVGALNADRVFWFGVQRLLLPAAQKEKGRK